MMYYVDSLNSYFKIIKPAFNWLMKQDGNKGLWFYQKTNYEAVMTEMKVYKGEINTIWKNKYISYEKEQISIITERKVNNIRYSAILAFFPNSNSLRKIEKKLSYKNILLIPWGQDDIDFYEGRGAEPIIL